MIGPLPVYYGVARGQRPSGDVWIVESEDLDGDLGFWTDTHDDEGRVVWCVSPLQAACFSSFADALMAYECRGRSCPEEVARAVCVALT